MAIDGVAHLDPAFSPFVPPPVSEFDAANARAVVRSEQRVAIREQWQVGQPYVDTAVYGATSAQYTVTDLGDGYYRVAHDQTNTEGEEAEGADIIHNIELLEFDDGCFVLAINRVGFEPDPRGPGGIQFFGSSFVAGPDGRVLAKAGPDAPAVIVTTLENAAIERARIGWPFMRDRRIDAYGAITSRWGG